MSDIAELASVCATATAQVRALALRMDRRPLDRGVLAEVGDFLSRDAPEALAAHEMLLAMAPQELEAEVFRVLSRIKDAS